MTLSVKMAIVDLTARTVQTRDVPPELRRAYLGGRGINMYLLQKYIQPGIDPLSPENVLILGVGLLSGTMGWGMARMNLSGKSPESGYLGDSNVGGEFASELKYAGWDHIVITGASPSPVYLRIDNDVIEIRDASGLWGQDTAETQKSIRRELANDTVKIACIGPAGENLVRFACVITGHKNAAGRTGMGALMGSKKLKAIAVRGSNDIPIAHPEEYMAHVGAVMNRLAESRWAQTIGRLGTPMLLGVSNELGFIGVRNHQTSSLGEKSIALEADSVLRYGKGMSACMGCHVHCRHRHEISEGRYAGTRGEGPENGAIAVGANLDCMDLEAIIHATDYCNLYGMDVDAFGQLVGWATELYQRGIIDQRDTGIPFEWGNADALAEIVHMVANRRGFGDVLAEGTRAPQIIGRGSADYLMTIKNRPSMGTDERAVKSFALGVATAARGYDHLRSRPGIDLFHLPKEFLQELYGGDVDPDFRSYDGKERMVWWHEVLFAVGDAVGSCRFQQIFNSPNLAGFDEFVELLHLAAGLDISQQEIKTVGERICTTERMFLAREGLDRRSDYPPKKYLTEPSVGGRSAGSFIDVKQYDRMLDEYYSLHGWDLNGIPRKETIERLGIDGLLALRV